MDKNQRNEIEQRANSATPGPWYAADCEGTLAIWPESLLRDVVRDENGQITGYRPAATYRPSHLIGEWELDTWDEGEDYDDDQRRANARFQAAARTDVPALVAEVKRLESEVARSTYCEGPEECIERECEEYYDEDGDELPNVEYCSHLSPKQVTFEDFQEVTCERDQAREMFARTEEELVRERQVWQGERESLVAELAKVRAAREDDAETSRLQMEHLNLVIASHVDGSEPADREQR